MSVMSDLLLVAEADYVKIDRTLTSIEERIADAGRSVDHWTKDQASDLRSASDELRARLDEYRFGMPGTGRETDFGKIRFELHNINDLRRAVATFEQYVSKWVGPLSPVRN